MIDIASLSHKTKLSTQSLLYYQILGKDHIGNMFILHLKVFLWCKGKDFAFKTHYQSKKTELKIDDELCWLSTLCS